MGATPSRPALCGACFSSPPKKVPLAPAVERFTVLVREALGLSFSGHAPVVGVWFACRLGTGSEKFEEKDAATEWVSHRVANTVDPRWNLGMAFPREKATPSAELHFQLHGVGLGGLDLGLLGEARVGICDLLEEEGVFIQRQVYKGTGSLFLCSGQQVHEAVLKHLQELSDRDPYHPGHESELMHFVHSVENYFLHVKTKYKYTRLMQQLLVAGNSSPDGWTKKSLELSADSTGKDTYMWQGPLDENCTCYSGHEEVRKRLAELGPKLGTNSTNGSVYRHNGLGMQLYGHGHKWPEFGPKGVMALSHNQETHAPVRPWVVGLVDAGKYDIAEVRRMAQNFFKDRKKLTVVWDLKVWVTQVLHKILLGIDLSFEEGAKFMTMQSKILYGIKLRMVLGQVMETFLGTAEALKERDELLKKFGEAIKARSAGKSYTEKQIVTLAAAAMDVLLYAGGASVPFVLAHCLGVLYSQWGREQLPKDFQLQKSNLTPFVMETIRRFPPVAAFQYIEKSLGATEDDHFVFLHLAMAQRDPRVWGEDSDAFRLRPLEEYQKKSVGWAEQAVCP